MYTYIGQWPHERQMGWSEEVQGITHDDNNWFFTQNGNLWKFPITHRLGDACKKENKPDDVLVTSLTKENVLGRQKAESAEWKIYAMKRPHMGDIDYYFDGVVGYVFVSAEVDFIIPVVGGYTVTINGVAVYRASDLSFVSFQEIKRPDGKDFTNIWWVAINPNNGLLYTSDGHMTENEAFLVYEVGDVTKPNALTFHSKARMVDEHKCALSRWHMQGGCFDNKNFLHIVNGNYTWHVAGHNNYDNSKGGISVFLVSQEPQKGGTEVLQRVTHSEQYNNALKSARTGIINPEAGKTNFFFNYDTDSFEPEGITYWDLDQDKRAPGDKKEEHVSGQLHAIVLDNDHGNPDDLTISHFRRTHNAFFYDVLLQTGDVDGAGTDAKLYITLYGLKGVSRECELVAAKSQLERGRDDHFVVEADKNIGVITQIKIRSDNTGKYPEYYLLASMVTELETKRSYVFNIGKWFSKSAGLSHTLTAAPSPVSYLGSVVLDREELRPGDWTYVKCKHGSAIADVPRDKVKTQWQRKPNSRSGEWENIPGETENPKRNLGVYAVRQADVGFNLRALITVDGYAGTLATEPVKVLRETLDFWRSTANRHVKLSPEKPRPGDTMTAKLSSLFDNMKIHYRWRWAGDTSDYHQTRSTDKTYKVTYDDLEGRIDLDITADGYDGCIISAAAQVVKDNLSGYQGQKLLALSPTDPKPGDTLTAKLSGRLAEIPSNMLHYQWQHSADGRNYSNYNVRPSAGHPVTESDVGRKIRLVITADKYDGQLSSDPVTVTEKQQREGGNAVNTRPSTTSNSRPSSADPNRNNGRRG